MLFAGNGYAQLSEILAAGNIPCMSQNTYMKYEKIASRDIHEAAEKVMEEARQEEIQYAIQKNNLDSSKRPLCTVVVDGQWNQRSFGTKFSSKSGWVCFHYNSLLCDAFSIPLLVAFAHYYLTFLLQQACLIFRLP